MQCTSWLSLGAQTGAITVIAAAGRIFSLRNISSNLVVVRRVGVGFIATTGFTAAQVVDFGMRFARAFSASDTGGTAIALTGNEAKVRTSLATLTSVDCRISTTAALGAGTSTLDTNTIAQVGGYALATTAGNIIAPQLNNLLDQSAGDHPIVLAQNEGFVIQVLTTMGAAGVGRAYVNVELAEATSF